MAGFQRRAWGAKPSESSDKWNLTIKSAKYSKNGDIGFKLGGFQYKDLPQLNKINPDVFFAKQDVSNNVWLWVKNGKYDEFIADVTPIENFLKQTNHYNDGSIKSFGEKIEHYADSTPTVEEIEANNEKIATNWRSMLEQMEDPEVRKKFLAFQTTYTCVSRYKDAALSPSNVVNVLAVDPQATFVTDKNTWMTKFKRQVQDGAPYIVITKAENTLPPINLLNQDPEVMAAGGWNKLVAQSGGPWYGAAYAAIKRVRLNNNVRAFFYHSKVYDVRYTTPVDPSHDPFMEIPNLINNLSGEINMAARALLDKENLEKGESNVDYGKKKEGITNNDELTAFKDFVLKKCKIAKVNVPLVGSDEDIVSNAVYAYAYAKAESLNKLHPKAKEAFANAVCYAIAATFNINSNRSAHSARFFNNLSPEDSKELAMDSFETYKALANFSLRESIGGAPHIMNFDEYAELLMNVSNNKRNVKSKFDDMMSRMDTVK